MVHTGCNTSTNCNLCRLPACRDIGFLSKLNCYWFFCRYFVFAIVTIVALLASPIVLWLDPWIWGFPTIYFLVSANVAVVVYLYFTIFSYIFLLFSVVSKAVRLLGCSLGATVGWLSGCCNAAFFPGGLRLLQLPQRLAQPAASMTLLTKHSCGHALILNSYRCWATSRCGP